MGIRDWSMLILRWTRTVFRHRIVAYYAIALPPVGGVALPCILLNVLIPQITFMCYALGIVGSDATKIASGTVVFDLIISGIMCGIDPHFARRHFQTRHQA